MGIPAPPSFDEFQASKRPPASEPPEPPKDYGDPNKWLRNPPSVFVQIQNTSRDDLNGQLGLVVGYQYDVGNTNGRYVIHLAMAQQRASFRPEKLRKASWLLSLLGQVQIVRYNPGIQELFRKLGTTQMLLVSFGILALLCAAVYIWGFAKTMTLASLGLIVALVVGPDFLQGKSAAQVWQNVPYNIKNLVRESFGDSVAASDWMTWSIVGLLILYAVWTMFGR